MFLWHKLEFTSQQPAMFVYQRGDSKQRWYVEEGKASRPPKHGMVLRWLRWTLNVPDSGEYSTSLLLASGAQLLSEITALITVLWHGRLLSAWNLAMCVCAPWTVSRILRPCCLRSWRNWEWGKLMLRLTHMHIQWTMLTQATWPLEDVTQVVALTHYFDLIIWYNICT